MSLNPSSTPSPRAGSGFSPLLCMQIQSCSSPAKELSAAPHCLWAQIQTPCLAWRPFPSVPVYHFRLLWPCHHLCLQFPKNTKALFAPASFLTHCGPCHTFPLALRLPATCQTTDSHAGAIDGSAVKSQALTMVEVTTTIGSMVSTTHWPVLCARLCPKCFKLHVLSNSRSPLWSTSSPASKHELTVTFSASQLLCSWPKIWIKVCLSPKLLLFLISCIHSSIGRLAE